MGNGDICNPNNNAFRVALNSEIYIDKTELLSYTNKVIDTKERLICNTRPRRFGKSTTAGKNKDFGLYLNKCNTYRCTVVQHLCKTCRGVKRWYDGYLLKGQHIYNPKAVVSVMIRGNFKSYWSMTGTYESILSLINMDFEGLRTDIIRMLSGGTVKMDISSFQNDMVTFKDKDDILTALVHLGYLAYNEKERVVFIPNEEIRSEFAKVVKRKKWNEMEVMQEMNKDEIKIIKNAEIYEIRLMLDVDDKETYTKDEILKLLDTIARAEESE